jgi:hypothetical protein
MYCPQCGTESSSGLQYCRSCGANLKVIGKAVTLSEAIARSDRGPVPKIKEMMKRLTPDEVTEDISRAMEEMSSEMVRSTDDLPFQKAWKLPGRKKKTAAERREKHMVTGAISIFSGIGLAIFLYYLTGALVLKLPADVVAQVPFEIDPVVRILWLVGLMPALTGVGHILAGLMIQPDPVEQIAPEKPIPRLQESELRPTPTSVTERTTNLLDHELRKEQRF